jgi:hypothetical protein
LVRSGRSVEYCAHCEIYLTANVKQFPMTDSFGLVAELGKAITCQLVQNRPANEAYTKTSD